MRRFMLPLGGQPLEFRLGICLGADILACGMLPRSLSEDSFLETKPATQ